MASIPSSSRFLSAQPDERLVQLIRDGHERAFETLVARYRRQLLAYCVRLMGTRGTAEDTLQQTLLLAWSAIRSGAEIRDLSAWLHRIAHNVAISNLRRAAAATDASAFRAAPHSDGPDEELERRVAAREALAGLAALPDAQRTVMLATALEGRSHEELAGALGLTSAAVRGLIYRARAALRTAAAAVLPWSLLPASGAGEAPSAATTGGTLGAGGAGIGGLLLKGGAALLAVATIASAPGLISAPGRHRLSRRHALLPHPQPLAGSTHPQPLAGSTHPQPLAGSTHRQPRRHAPLLARAARNAAPLRRGLPPAPRHRRDPAAADRTPGPLAGHASARSTGRAQIGPALTPRTIEPRRARRGEAASKPERVLRRPGHSRGESREGASRLSRSRGPGSARLGGSAGPAPPLGPKAKAGGAPATSPPARPGGRGPRR